MSDARHNPRRHHHPRHRPHPLVVGSAEVAEFRPIIETVPSEGGMVQSSPARRSPVMADVAEAAGVSHQTVSRVLNGHPHVREKTRAKILQAVERLGYRRNMMARALVTRRSRTLGAVIFGTTLHGPASTLYGVEQAARAVGYVVSIVSLKTLDGQETQEALSYLETRALTESSW